MALDIKFNVFVQVLSKFQSDTMTMYKVLMPSGLVRTVPADELMLI